MEKQFYTRFSKAEPEVCTAKFSTVTQRSRETTYLFIVVNHVNLGNLKVETTYLPSAGSFTCPLLVEKKPDLWKKSQTSNTQAQYIFEVAKIEEIFDFLVKEKFITFP